MTAQSLPPRNAHPRAGPDCLSERQLAERWQSSTRTLQRWRAAGTGPAFLRIGGLIRYPLADVEAFEAAGRSMPDGNGGG